MSWTYKTFFLDDIDLTKILQELLVKFKYKGYDAFPNSDNYKEKSLRLKKPPRYNFDIILTLILEKDDVRIEIRTLYGKKELDKEYMEDIRRTTFQTIDNYHNYLKKRKTTLLLPSD